MRVIATGGMIGIGVAIAAILASSDVQGWIIGLVVSSSAWCCRPSSGRRARSSFRFFVLWRVVESGAAISTRGLSKSYGDVRALCGVDLDVARGTVLGLLGPNGAGKTTIVRILTTLLEARRRQRPVAGLDVVRDAAKLREQIGLAGQYAAVDENLTGLENLTMVGRLYGKPRRTAKARGERAARALRPRRRGARGPCKTYSGGMRRRLDLAAALVAKPPVLFLDEPTTGLDPRSRLALWEVIEELGRRGHDRAADDAVPRRGRPARGPDRGDRPRPGDRRGHVRRAQGPRRRRAPRGHARRRGRRRRRDRARSRRCPTSGRTSTGAIVRLPVRERKRRDRRGGAPAERGRRRRRRPRAAPPDARRRVPDAHRPRRRGGVRGGGGGGSGA